MLAQQGQGIKRCLSTEDARELGCLLKKSRQHSNDSKKVLATPLGLELLQMNRRFENWSNELTEITQRSVEIKATLDNAKFQALVTFDDWGLCSRLNALSDPALAQVRAAMKETWAGGGPAEAALDKLWDIVLTTDDHLPVGQDGNHKDLLRRIAHYFAAPLVPVQVKLLRESLEKKKRPGIIETEADEELEQAYVYLFAKAKAALVEVQEITQDRALTMFDLACFANHLHDGLLRMKASTTRPGSSSNLVEIEKLYVDIGQNNIGQQHFSKVQCAVCLEERVDTSKCNECLEGSVCVECFGGELAGLSDRHWEDRVATSRLAVFGCHNCKHGRYDSRLFNLLPYAKQALHRQAVEKSSRLDTLDEVRMERCRELTCYTADGGATYMEKLFKMERLAIGNLVATRCPKCAMEFYDFRECCALQCAGCSTHFCALCLHGETFWTSDCAHFHVLECSLDSIGAEGIFMKLEDWMVHNRMRQYRLCRAYLAKTDLPRTLKTRLQNAFPRPAKV